MHIPNGFLTDPVCAVTTAAATVGLAASAVRLRQSQYTLGQYAPPGTRMAVTGAGIFAAQMVNFNIDHGTSGHLLGAALAAILLGPWAGSLVMSVVLIAQCLLFADGGLTALGANTLNMALVAVWTASAVYHGTARWVDGPRGKLLGAALAAWLSVMAAACACSVELALSGTHRLIDVLSPMAAVHALIGLSEALITTAVVAMLLAAESRMPRQVSPVPSHRGVLLGLAVALAIAALVAPWASSAPDGLERVATMLHLSESESGGTPVSFAPDYLWPGIAWPPLAIAAAGMLGVAAVFAASYFVGRATVAALPRAASHETTSPKAARH